MMRTTSAAKKDTRNEGGLAIFERQAPEILLSSRKYPASIVLGTEKKMSVKSSPGKLSYTILNPFVDHSTIRVRS
jgi:hypothetical protein